MKKVFAIIFIGLSFAGIAQHYPMYSQYLLNGLAINPAYAGRNEALDITLMHRRQWVGFDGAPVTTALTVNSPLRNKAISLGLSVIDDRIGITNNQIINLMYAYRLKVGNMKLSFGIQSGIEFNKVNWDALKRNDQQDALINNQSIRQTSFVTGAGAYLYGKKLFVGLSSPYIINTLNKLSYKESPILLNAGYLFTVSKDNVVKPSILIKKVFNSPTQVDINVNYYYKKLFGIGVSYRTKEAIVGILELGLNEQFKICYSYDFTINKLKNYQSGSHELLLRYYFGYTFYAKNPRSFYL